MSLAPRRQRCMFLMLTGTILCLLPTNRYDASSRTRGWSHRLAITCLSPAVAFTELAGAARSIVLTSGTLSPLESFGSELGTHFPVTLEAAHVINTQRQVLALAVPKGPMPELSVGAGTGLVGRQKARGAKLIGTFANAQSFEYLDGLGSAVLQLCAVAPGGALLFFPSYVGTPRHASSTICCFTTTYHYTGVPSL